jgi:hypothetical protein
MANTTAMNRAEAYIRSRHFGPKYEPRKLRLTWGGEFAFDAVSPDGKTAAVISTSAARTASGRVATGKIIKILKDVLYLMAARGVRRRVLLFTELSMFREFQRMQAVGRLPLELELQRFALNRHHRQRVRDARAIASDEVAPR